LKNTTSQQRLVQAFTSHTHPQRGGFSFFEKTPGRVKWSSLRVAPFTSHKPPTRRIFASKKHQVAAAARTVGECLHHLYKPHTPATHGGFSVWKSHTGRQPCSSLPGVNAPLQATHPNEVDFPFKTTIKNTQLQRGSGSLQGVNAPLTSHTHPQRWWILDFEHTKVAAQLARRKPHKPPQRFVFSLIFLSS